jgi:prepilin-type N-terminal cleavage/methylation domain-containing protein
MNRVSNRRRGMTLVELLVVIIILGLLGVATAPAISPANSKRKLRDAAGSVSSHLLRAAADAVGSRSGRGAWLEADAKASDSPTTVLRFCVGTVEAETTATIAGGSSTSATRSVTLSPSYQALTGSTAAPSGSTLRLVGMPYEYALLPDAATLALRVVNGSPAPTSALVWPQTAPGGSLFPCTLQIPPDRASGGRTALASNTCVDLPESTFGVASYSGSWQTFNNSGPVRVTFDNVGRPKAVTACFGTSGTAETRKIEPRTPIAFFVGFRDQVGQAYVANPTDDDPGSNLQRKDAWWVVLDPRTGTIFEVENAPNTHNLAAAQKFIRQRLLNDPNAP